MFDLVKFMKDVVKLLCWCYHN